MREPPEPGSGIPRSGGASRPPGDDVAPAGGDRDASRTGHGAGAREAADSSDPLVGTVFHDKYRVLQRLGAGGFGTVYRVRNLRLEAAEALKVIHRHVVLDEAQVSRFRQEAQLLRRLGMRSPHIPLLHDFDRDEEHGVWFFTLEFVSGTTLRETLLEGPLSIPRAVSILRQVCAALSVAHGEASPVVHRDLKPDNVMVVEEDGQDRVKILDFGIARILGEKGFTSTQGGVPGSAGFIAPEQFDGEPDPRTDLFAAGVTLYQVLTGRDPWVGSRAGEPSEPGEAHRILRRSLFDAPIPPRDVDPEIPEELERIILRLLEKSLDDRFQSADELDAALAGVERASEVTAEAGRGRGVEGEPTRVVGERPTRVVEEQPTRVVEERRGEGAAEGGGTPGPESETGVATRFRAGIRRVPGGVRSVAAVLVAAALVAGAAALGLPGGGGEEEANGGAAQTTLTPAEVTARLASEEVRGATVAAGGPLTVRLADGSSAVVSWGGSGWGLRGLLVRLRDAGVAVEALGEAGVRIRARRPGDDRPAEVARLALEGGEGACAPCPLESWRSVGAGWHALRPLSDVWRLDSVLVVRGRWDEAVGAARESGSASGEGARPSASADLDPVDESLRLPSREAIPDPGAAPDVFLAGGFRTDLTLVLEAGRPLPADSLSGLTAAAESAFRRGAYLDPAGDNVAYYLERILSRAPTHRRALTLRDELTRSYLRLIGNVLERGDTTTAREIRKTCLQALPGSERCRNAIR